MKKLRSRSWFDNPDNVDMTALYLEQLDPYIGDRPVDHIDDEALAPYVKDRLAGRLRGSPGKGRSVAPRTINIALERVIRVLNLCARKWRDEARRPWLDTVPMITRLDLRRSTRQPHPLSSSGLRARRPARARMELDAESPAASWVAWEVSRRGRPPRQADSEQREG